MSVLLETSLGDLVIDLEVEACPKTCENFLKLCKAYYYNLNAFFNVSKDFLAQTGDPSASGTGGESVWSYISSKSPSPSTSSPTPPRYFTPEIVPSLKHNALGTVSMAIAPSLVDKQNKEVVGGCGSQFFITLSQNIPYLDGKHAVFGHVVEGLEDTLPQLNDVYTDQQTGRPFKDVRIRHIVILDDPFPDPPGLQELLNNGTLVEPTKPPDNSTRIAEDEDPLADADLPEDVVEEMNRKKAAAASALTLEMVGDLPFANVRPPENVLFVCKLNSVTRDEDLELIFSRFGTIMSCQVIRDKATGDSLQYAFIEFDKREEAEQAYFKMQNVLIDDRRIWVDFSQSVARLNTQWSNNPAMASRGGGRGGRGSGRGGGRGGRGGGERRDSRPEREAPRDRDFGRPRERERDYDRDRDDRDRERENERRPAARGRPRDVGFAGREDLEETRRYRASEANARSGGSYGMVFDVGDASAEPEYESGRKRRKRDSRSGSQSPDRKSGRSSRSPKSRQRAERSVSRERDVRRQSPPRRSGRSREREKDRERDKDRDREYHYHDRDRGTYRSSRR